MAAAVSIAQTFDPLFHPVRVPADQTWIAPAALDLASAESRLREAILPHLTHRDDRDALRLSPSLVYAPFWRVKLAVAGAELAPPVQRVAIGNIEFPMPLLSFGGRAGVLMISARTAVPYTPRLPAFFGGTESDALEVQRSELVPLTSDNALAKLARGEIIDADVDRERGQAIAVATLVTMLQSRQRAGHLPSTFDPRVESTAFVLYPLHYASFGPDGHHVLLSARDGKVVSARYPRPPTISERVKRFFIP